MISNKQEFIKEFTRLCYEHVDHLHVEIVMGHKIPAGLQFKDGSFINLGELFSQAEFMY